MKKLMIACAAALAAFTAAQAAEVSSANIVGTQTITLKGTGNGASGYNMIAVNWDAVGGETIDLKTFFSDDDLAKMQAGTFATKADADQIKIWDPVNGYTNYYLKKRNNGQIQGWASETTDEPITSVPLAKGTAFWFYRQASSDIEVTIKGEVSTDPSVTFEIAGKGTATGYNMIGAGYPVDFMLNGNNKFAWDTGTAGTFATKTDADQIKVWDPVNGYTNYYLKKRNNGQIQGWASETTDELDDNAKIPAGGAAWYYRQAATDIEATEVSPVPLAD